MSRNSAWVAARTRRAARTFRAVVLCLVALSAACTTDVTLGGRGADSAPLDAATCAGEPNCGGDGTPGDGCTAGDPNCDGTPGDGCTAGDPNCTAAPGE